MKRGFDRSIPEDLVIAEEEAMPCDVSTERGIEVRRRKETGREGGSCSDCAAPSELTHPSPSYPLSQVWL